MSDITDVLGIANLVKAPFAWGLAPTQLKRLRAAETEAEIDAEIYRIEREWEVALARLKAGMDLSIDQRGALQRHYEDSLGQKNLEQVLARTIPKLEREPEGITQEWIRKWTENAKRADFEDAQRIWAELFTMEVNSGGSVSLKTMNVLSSCTSIDLISMRSTLSNCVTMFDKPHLFVYSDDYEILAMEELVRLGILVGTKRSILSESTQCELCFETIDESGTTLFYRVVVSIPAGLFFPTRSWFAFLSPPYELTDVGIELSKMMGLRALSPDILSRSLERMTDYHRLVRVDGFEPQKIWGEFLDGHRWIKLEKSYVDEEWVSIEEVISSPEMGLKRSDQSETQTENNWWQLCLLGRGFTEGQTQ